MVLKPCVDDLLSIFGTWIVVILCELFCCTAMNGNGWFLYGILILNILLIFASAKDCLYFGRVITLSSNGAEVSFLRYRKHYAWQDVEIHFYNPLRTHYFDSEEPSSGIVIMFHGQYNIGKKAPMTFCRYHHPFSSVFIRFDSDKNRKTIIYGKTVYKGYLASKSEIIDYLTSVRAL